MLNLSSPASFKEQELLFKEVPKEWKDPGLFEKVVIDLQIVFRKELEVCENLVEETKSTFLFLNDKIKFEKDNHERKREKKDMLFTKVISVKQSLDELLLKKTSLKKGVVDFVSKEELSEMLEKVVQLEKEQEIRQVDLKTRFKAYVGQMCFYKDYLNIYIDLISCDNYVFYFKKCRPEDNNKPQEWIQIKTDDFKKFVVVDVASRGKINHHLLKQIKSYDKYLKEVISEARELCLDAV